MSRLERHPERHLVARIGWLRAAVLGANDGLVSTASLVVGVAAAEAARGGILIAGVAGLVAGANTSRSAPSPTPKRPTSPAKPPNWRPIRKPRSTNWPPSTPPAAWSPPCRVRWRSS